MWRSHICGQVVPTPARGHRPAHLHNIIRSAMVALFTEVYTMFETLFSYPTVVRHHCEGPLAAERVEYLGALASRGMAWNTILCRASYCLCVAKELERWPANHCLSEQAIEALASTWAAERVASGRASASDWPERHFRFAATDFLRTLNRLRSLPISSPPRFHDELEGFIAAQQQSRWSSEATCRSARWQITKFLGYLEQRQLGLGELTPSHVDDFFQQMAQRWGRNSLRTSAKMLRAWFTHCEAGDWVRAGLAKAILLPRIYRHEGLPMGPTWKVISRVVTETAGDDPASLRDHAIILLLSVIRAPIGRGSATTARRYRLATRPASADSLQK